MSTLSHHRIPVAIAGLAAGWLAMLVGYSVLLYLLRVGA